MDWKSSEWFTDIEHSMTKNVSLISLHELSKTTVWISLKDRIGVMRTKGFMYSDVITCPAEQSVELTTKDCVKMIVCFVMSLQNTMWSGFFCINIACGELGTKSGKKINVDVEGFALVFKSTKSRLY